MWRFEYVHSVKDCPFYSPTGSWKWNNPIFHLVDICQPSHSQTVNICIIDCVKRSQTLCLHILSWFLSLILDRHPDDKRRYRRQINSLPILGNVVQYHDTCNKVDIFSFVVKGERCYFSKFSFSFHLINQYSIDVFKISVETVMPFRCPKQFCILQLPISYCVSLIMVTSTRHIDYGYQYQTHFQ